MAAELLSRHKHAFHWLHIIGVLGSLCVVTPAIAWSAPFSPMRALLIFAIALVAWCQNIGLMHEGELVRRRDDFLFVDFVHPNRHGHALLAAQLNRVIAARAVRQ
jgi:hypothetical protein